MWALLGATPAMAFLGLHTTQVLTLLPPGILAIGVLVGALCGWIYALLDLTSDAKTARREFRHALASYLELVTILMAGGAGTETACIGILFPESMKTRSALPPLVQE